MKNMLDISLQEAIGPIKTLIERLTGENGKQWLVAFKRFLRKEDPWANSLMFKEVKNLKTDVEVSSEELLERLEVSNSEDHAEYLLSILDPNKSNHAFFMEQFGLKPEQQKIVFVSVKDLGFEKEATLAEILKRAEEHGLQELGPIMVSYLSCQGEELELPPQTLVPTTSIHKEDESSEPEEEKILFELSLDSFIKKTGTSSVLEKGVIIKEESALPDALWGAGTIFAFRIK